MAAPAQPPQVIANNLYPAPQATVHNLLNNLVTGADHEAVGEGLTDPQKQTQYNQYAHILQKEFEGGKEDQLSPLCPHSVIHLVLAQHHAIVNSKPGNVGNVEPVRMRNFYCLTVGFGFTLLARIIRVAIRTALLIPSLLFSAYMHSKYHSKMIDAQGNNLPGKHNIVTEDLRRFGYEWLDLALTIASPVIALIHTAAPQAIPLASLRERYARRIDDVREKDRAFKIASKIYSLQQAEMQRAFDQAAPAN